ncbi:MAG: A/G-specific adenine glycosylase [Deltaproteobacteria bacterium]|nr:A/G-specific adenine glycosylase [Deltaproteobacteria bacterium]
MARTDARSHAATATRCFTPAAQRSLLGWAARELRVLPWRATRDPWAILVAELMLQQTQVARVAPRYRAFLARFPTPAACARATVGDVVTEWAGLGYNRRAVALHRCARVCVEEHGGALPAALEPLHALPGVGPYTARAILVFAFERDVGVVDTNVGRVLARMRGAPLAPAQAQAAADAAVPRGRAWLWNQALFDLGALTCTKRAPACARCPLRRSCAWRRAGCEAPDPAVGSAGVSGGQSRFEGSDRQGRGRLVDALRARGHVARAALAAAAGWPGDAPRARRVAAGLVKDGLAASDGRGGLRSA